MPRVLITETQKEIGQCAEATADKAVIKSRGTQVFNDKDDSAGAQTPRKKQRGRNEGGESSETKNLRSCHRFRVLPSFPQFRNTKTQDFFHKRNTIIYEKSTLLSK